MVSTNIGGIATIFILTLVFAYAAITFLQLNNRQNPTIVETTIEHYYDSKDTVALNKINQRFAFAFVNFETREMRDSPEFVKIIARQFNM